MKKLLVFILLFCLTFSLLTPAFAAAEKSGSVSLTVEGTSEKNGRGFFKTIIERIKTRMAAARLRREIRKEGVKNTMYQNAIHMLKSVTDTIGDSFIITTEDGKVIVIDGGHKTETDYFVEYLKTVTGQEKPYVDVWFLSHAHDDHCEVFLEIAENRSDVVSFGKVYANFPEASFYEGIDEWGVYIIDNFNRLKPAFADKVAELHEGYVFNVGAAKFTVFYTFNPEWTNVNEGSTIMKMELGGTSVMFDGDAEENAGNYVVEKYGDALRCDYCKMSHHGQSGVGRNFYEAVAPEVCFWPTPTWVYDNVNGNLRTFETRAWVEELGVKKEYKSFEGSVAIGMKPRIVTTTDVFQEGYPADKAQERLARLGYEGIDMGLDYWTFEDSPFMGDGYLDWARELKAKADEIGVPYTHAHAPGDAGSGDVIGRSIEVASVLGARYLVVHPIWKDENGKEIKSKKQFIKVNAEAIRQWLPLAEKRGVVLLSENILWSASSDPRIIAELVKEVDSPLFGWCFDTGHANSSGYKPEILKKCAVAPLSVHLQDNHGGGDEHLIPGDGTIDWARTTEALKSVGYLGDCVMEAHHQSLEAPDEERDEILGRLLEKSKELQAELR